MPRKKNWKKSLSAKQSREKMNMTKNTFTEHRTEIDTELDTKIHIKLTEIIDTEHTTEIGLAEIDTEITENDTKHPEFDTDELTEIDTEITKIKTEHPEIDTKLTEIIDTEQTTDSDTELMELCTQNKSYSCLSLREFEKHSQRNQLPHDAVSLRFGTFDRCMYNMNFSDEIVTPSDCDLNTYKLSEKNLKLEKCDEVFSENYTCTLQHHMITCNSDKPIKSDVFGKGPVVNYNPGQRIKTHTSNKQHKCGVCGNWVNSNIILQHMNTHANIKIFKCGVCGKKFSAKSDLSRHVRWHTSEHPSSCNASDSSFDNYEFLRKKITSTGVRPYKCNMCDKSFTLKGALILHGRQHTARKHYNDDVPQLCVEGFDLRVQQHMNIQTGDQPYKSDVTGTYNKSEVSSKGFSASFRSEQRIEPLTDDTSDVGGKGFNANCHSEQRIETLTGDNAVRDQEIIANCSSGKHTKTCTGEKLHKCCVCGKRFTADNFLQQHMRKHTGEKPYICTVCSKSFSVHGKLMNHMRRTHTGTQSRSCNKYGILLNSGNLKKHTRMQSICIIDRSYKCNVCDRVFISDRSLNIHLTTHKDRKPYKCDVCTQGFRDNLSLLQHMNKHTGDKPFKCDVCGKGFSSKYDLEQHIETHTNDKPCMYVVKE